MADPSITELTKQVSELQTGSSDLTMTTAANVVWTLVAVSSVGLVTTEHAIE